MSKDTAANDAHFRGIADRYLESLNDGNKVMYANIRNRLNALITGILVDIGNGGVFTYDTEIPQRIIAVDPAFWGQENVMPSPNIEYMPTIASRMPSIADASVDTVLMQFILHHIVGKTLDDAEKEVAASLREVHRILRPGGRLIIVEMITSSFIEKCEELLYSITRFGFSLIGKPMVKFFSIRGLRRRLQTAGFGVVEIESIDMGASFDIMGGWAPGIIRMPSKISPLRCTILHARKSDTPSV